MRLFSYIVRVDAGFAPNPFWGILTLACCKPKIRLTAQRGDLIVGLAPARLGNGVVYVAKVDQRLTFQEYWLAPRFVRKRPDMNAAATKKRRGDNIYKPLGQDTFRQLPSGHSHGPHENAATKKRDLGGKGVLTSREFSYFGAGMIPLPRRFRSLIVGRAHRCRFSPELVAQVNAWRKTLPRGVQNRPRNWPNEDASCRL